MGLQEQPPPYHSLFTARTDPVTTVQQPLLPVNLDLEIPPPPLEDVDQPLTLTETCDTRINIAPVGPPPPYEASFDDSPPSYDTLFGRVMAMHNQSTGRIDFIKKFYTLLRETLGCTLFLGIIMAVPVTMIIMGCMHLFDCPAEQYIPLYLLVGGIAVTAKIMKALIEMYKCKDPACASFKLSTAGNNTLEVLLIFFIVGWFIAGNMWIYRTHGRFDSRNPRAENYCSPYVFYFAFWLTTSVYILFALFLCCMYGISALGSKSS